MKPHMPFARIAVTLAPMIVAAATAHAAPRVDNAPYIAAARGAALVVAENKKKAKKQQQQQRQGAPPAGGRDERGS